MAFKRRPRKVKVGAGSGRDLERFLRDQDGTDPRPGESGPDDGGAGVREPRRPKPTRPGAAAAVAEPAADGPPAALASN